MKLSELIKNIMIEEKINFKDVDVEGISYNSKTIKPSELFVCLKGEVSDGHDYAKMTVENGACAIVAEKKLDDIDVSQIIVKSTRHQIADLLLLFTIIRLKI